MNALLGLNLGKGEMVRYAGKVEGGSSGTQHYDNVSAAIYGGFVVVRGGRQPEATAMEPPASLRICVASPRLKLPKNKTEYARSVLPRKVTLRQMVTSVASATTLVAGIAKGDFALIGEGMRDDVVEPVRGRFIPGHGRVRAAAMGAGASGVLH